MASVYPINNAQWHRMRPFNRTAFMVAAVVFLGCSSVLLSCVTTGPGGKKSFLIFGTNDEIAIGERIDEQVRAESTLLADPQWQKYITEVGEKLVAVSDRRDLQYHFAVIDSDQINAFALPGGYIYFYTGLLANHG